jgi:hypothetical protein
MKTENNILKLVVIIFVVALLGTIFYTRARQESNLQKEAYTNFFVFWLSGELILNAQSPYNSADWLAGHKLNGYESPAEPIFLYPLPLAIFLTPLGFFSYTQAFLLWKILSQVFLAIAIFILLSKWQLSAQQRFFAPLVLISLYYGPTLLAQRSGSVGLLTLLLITLAIFFIQRKQFAFASGVLLAFTMLKPPQGALILLLFGVWLLKEKNWKVFQGIVFGGILLWVIGASVDFNWVAKFLNSSESAFDRRLGVHSNVWSFSFLICEKDMACTYLLGAGSAIILLGLVAFYLWQKHNQVSVWEAMNLIIPIGFVSTVYLWAYDQVLYIIPITWIVGTLIQKTKSYIFVFIFLVILISYAFFAIAKVNVDQHDLWSLGNTLIVLFALLFTTLLKEKSA